jgi:hypothetical protein
MPKFYKRALSSSALVPKESFQPILIVPTLRAHRYTQVLPSQKCRHFGKDAEIQAMDGNSPLCKCLIQCTRQPADSPPCDWIPAIHAGMTGFHHLCITMSAPRGNAASTAPTVHDAEHHRRHSHGDRGNHVEYSKGSGLTFQHSSLI